MPFKTIAFETHGPVGVLTLNRPEALNALNIEIISEVLEVVRGIRADAKVRALVITGAGRGFCAGADLRPPASDDGLSRGERTSNSMDTHFNPLIQEIDELNKPVVAAVNGVTAGGGVGFALAADIVVAARSAKFIQVFAPRLAIVPDMGATWYLTHLLGRARARGLALTGEPLSAEKAEAWGMIWKCVDDAALMDEAMGIAQRLAASSTKALGMTMAALDAAEHNDLPAQLRLERYIQAHLTDRPAFEEGVLAFLEKREPDFSDD